MKSEPIERKISNWGQFPLRTGKCYEFSSLSELKQMWPGLQSGFIPRGMGRCYGDASLGPKMLSTRKFSHFLEWDSEQKLLIVESGITLRKIITTMLPKGYFLPVTPGTSLVTLGGALAADVHGKNHHLDGSLGEFVEWFDLRLPQGETVRCSRYENVDLFYATLGGMGLTGFIINIALRLLPIETSWIAQSIDFADDLETLMNLFDTNVNSEYSVAWIDCLSSKQIGRGILLSGRHLKSSEIRHLDCNQLAIDLSPRFKIPCNLPDWFLEPWFVRVFNSCYAQLQEWNSGANIVPLENYFYPLDIIGNWNLMYGSRGFIQYQCVLPLSQSFEGLTQILKDIRRANQGSFLAVLKKFGAKHSGGWLSFPLEGYTLALDFPRRNMTEKLLKRLDEIVKNAGGRLYLAKDSRGSQELYESSYLNWDKFKNLRRIIDPNRIIKSDLAMRLGL